MIPQWFTSWVSAHAQMFGFSDSQIRTMLAWSVAFTAKFTPDELHAATVAMAAASDTAKYPDDQRKQIVGHIEDARRRQREYEARADISGGRPPSAEDRAYIRRRLREAGLVQTPLENP